MSSSQGDILEAWKKAVAKNAGGDSFLIDAIDKREEIKNRTDEFLRDPVPDTFTEMWKTGYSVGQAVEPTPILQKWDGPMESLAELIHSITKSYTYQPEWKAPKATH